MMIFVGIDVSKDTFDVALPKEKGYRTHKWDNQASGFASLLTHLPEQAQCVMEATGPYYLRLATYLDERGIPVSVVNPLVIKRFAQMKRSRTKTDKADACLIAEYGRLHEPSPWQPPLAWMEDVQQENSLLEQLLKQGTALQNHRHALLARPHISEKALHTLEEVLSKLNEQIQDLEESITQKSKDQCAPLVEVLASIPGIGMKTAIHLLVITRAFTRFDNAKQLSAYVGLSPRLYESGSSVKGKVRMAKLGMAKMRTLLYMCAWSASKQNKACQELYQRLLAKGKAKKLALIAVANKLLTQAFAIATSLTPYQEPTTQTATKPDLTKQNLAPA